MRRKLHFKTNILLPNTGHSVHYLVKTITSQRGVVDPECVCTFDTLFFSDNLPGAIECIAGRRSGNCLDGLKKVDCQSWRLTIVIISNLIQDRVNNAQHQVNRQSGDVGSFERLAEPNLDRYSIHRMRVRMRMTRTCLVAFISEVETTRRSDDKYEE